MSSGFIAPRRDAGSFRDPTSHVLLDGDRVVRVLNDEALRAWRNLRRTRFFESFSADGRIVGTRELASGDPAADGWAGALEHELIPAISYPYEWPFSMLKAAALLTLDIMDAALDEDLILKDATPFNVQFVGARPTFIDIGSFRQLEAGEAWLGYRQFCRMFLYPLMLRAYKGVSYRPWLRGRLDGISAAEFRSMLRPRDLFKPGVLLDVALQARAERRYEASGRDVRAEIKEAGFRKELIQNNVRRLRKITSRLAIESESSEWSDYAAAAHVQTQRETKAEFLKESLGTPSLVWDVGANDGYFSRIAAESGAYVVSIDSDEVVADRLYRSLERNESILPLAADLGDPSPGAGWRQRERSPLEERAKPDLVIMFAVIHHVVIGGNVPVVEVVDWLAELDTRVVLEFVPLGDPMTDLLTVNKKAGEIHPDYNEASLRSLLSGRFEIDQERRVDGSERVLFALSPTG